MRKRYELGGIRGVVVSLAVLLFLVLSAEITLRSYLYTKTDYGKTLAVVRLVEYAQKLLLKAKIDKTTNEIFLEYNEIAEIAGLLNIKDPGMIRGKLKDYLFMEPGKELLEDFSAKYSSNFDALIKKANEIDAKVFVLYFPMTRIHDDCKNLYRSLAKKHGLGFLDMTETIKAHPVRYCHYAPENGHYSRFGYQIIAEKLEPVVREHMGHRSKFVFNGVRPKRMGDKQQNTQKILEDNNGKIVYREYVNAQGFKMMHDLEFPKKRQRVLCLGDSFTEGPLVPTHDSYVGFLEKNIPEVEFINAGVGSYSIEDQKNLLIERAFYSEPDVIFLQVLDNDLFDQFFFYRNFLSRSGRDYKPTEKELEFFKKVKEYRKVNGTLTHINDL